MRQRIRRLGLLMLGPSLALGTVQAQATRKEAGRAVSNHAKGTFEVKLSPPAEVKDGLASGRLTFDKTFQGDLVGTSKGEMWTTDTGVKGSAGYVAIEKVTGALRGRQGGFTLLHQATMRRGGEYKMSLVVVPDSGTGELTGLTGTLAIDLSGGKHAYDLEYVLPDAP